MCGIAGIVSRGSERRVDRAVLERIRDHMRSRGPDDDGLVLLNQGRVGLAHRRLAILDLSPAGHQPMSDATGLTIVYNGEIYNFQELRRDLELQGFRFRSNSDTEVLLALYRRYGPAMLPKLRGMFAFAIWDETQGRLVIARDTHGIKPLYYRQSPDFAFASQVKALLADPATDRSIDAVGAVGFAVWGSVPEPHTLVDSIRMLPAGHYLIVDEAGDPGSPVPFLTLPDLMRDASNDARIDLGDALRDSVAKHLVSDVEVGCFLSSGVDSSAILAMMTDAGAQSVRAITLRFEEFLNTDRDETPLAAEMAARYGAVHHVETISRTDFEQNLPTILSAMDQPSIDGVNSWFVSRAAANAGLKVALSGLGGDELLAGYSTFANVPATYRRGRRIARVPGLRRLASFTAERFLRGKAAHVLSHAGTFAGSYVARRAMLLPEQIGGILPPEVIRAGLAAFDPATGPEDVLQAVGDNDVQRVSVLESTYYMRNQLLRDSDWAGMAHSLEIRLPLVDVTLSRAVAPYLLTLRPGEGKQIIASAPHRPLPQALIERRKTGFGIPVARWTAGRGTSERLADGWASRVLTDYLSNERITL